jgi:hypothetical protein
MRYGFRISLCVFGILTSPFCNAAELGRLFYTAEQRAQMDHSFVQDGQPDDSALILNGIVQRHGGKRTAWINGVPQQAGNSDEKTPESLSVALPGQSKSVKLKVGQRVLLYPSAKPDAAKPDTPKADALYEDVHKP